MKEEYSSHKGFEGQVASAPAGGEKPFSPSPSGQVGELIRQIDAAADMLERRAGEMKANDWKNLEVWFQEFVVLEASLRLWTRDTTKDNEMYRQVLPHLVAFRNRLKVFSGLFSSRLLFLRGMAYLISKGDQHYSRMGMAISAQERTRRIDLREEA